MIKSIKTIQSTDKVQFTASSGRHSVLERPFSEANGRLFSPKANAYRALILTV